MCPLHHIKAITMFTLSTVRESTMILSTQWRPTLLEDNGGLSIIVDCPEVEELKVHRALVATRFAGLVSWDGPRRSLASKGIDKRITITGYFKKSSITALDVHLYVTILRNIPELTNALIGSQSLFAEPAAMIVDFGHPRAMVASRDFIEEAIFVSPRIALVTSPKRTEEWCQLITLQLHSTPMDAITTVRFRKSRGGRAWARPEALPTQIRSTKARAPLQTPSQLESSKQRLRTTIAISSVATGEVEALMSLIMHHIGSIIQNPFHRSTGTAPMRPYDWKPMMDATGKWTGRIEFECSNTEEIKAVYSKMQGCGIEIQNTCYILELENHLLDLPTTVPTTSDDSRPTIASFPLQTPYPPGLG
jgi:hypothetical protein